MAKSTRASATAKSSAPKRLWVYHCKDGTTSIYNYHNARRCLVAKVNKNSSNFNVVVDWLSAVARNLRRNIDLVGDSYLDLAKALSQRGVLHAD